MEGEEDSDVAVEDVEGSSERLDVDIEDKEDIDNDSELLDPSQDPSVIIPTVSSECHGTFSAHHPEASQG